MKINIYKLVNFVFVVNKIFMFNNESFFFILVPKSEVGNLKCPVVTELTREIADSLGLLSLLFCPYSFFKCLVRIIALMCLLINLLSKERFSISNYFYAKCVLNTGASPRSKK